MSQSVRPAPRTPSPFLSKLISHAAVFLIAFLIGFIPMWMRTREQAGALAESRRALELVRLEHALATAAIDARRGDYEPARQAASSFFTSLRAEADKGEASAVTPARTNALQPVLAQRDEIITLLARSDPAAADRLSELYVSYRQLMSR